MYMSKPNGAAYDNTLSTCLQAAAEGEHVVDA